jgi:hypothetical protein
LGILFNIHPSIDSNDSINSIVCNNNPAIDNKHVIDNTHAIDNTHVIDKELDPAVVNKVYLIDVFYLSNYLTIYLSNKKVSLRDMFSCILQQVCLSIYLLVNLSIFLSNYLSI